MSVASFAVLGADVIQGGNINTDSSGGSNGLGEVSFSNGRSIFESDDIVVFEVTNPTATGEIGNGSSISDLTVFDNHADYQAYLASIEAGTPDTSLIKFDYAPQNPGQTATVQSDISGLGDSYVRFNANILLPQDGGPTLNNTLTIAPGTNIADSGGTLTIDRFRDFDLNFDDEITEDTTEEGNSDFFIGDYIEIINGGPVCFVSGTMIATPDGDQAIETLSVGDLVLTQDHGPQAIRWIGQQQMPAMGAYAPVHFAPGALGNAHPFEVSPNHRILIKDERAELLFGESEVLIAAKHLINDQTIRLRKGGTVQYVHLLFDEHEIVTTDNVQSESLLPDWDTLSKGTNAQQNELFTLFPEAFQARSSTTQTARPCLRQYEVELLLR
jgi:hypothetical protein